MPKVDFNRKITLKKRTQQNGRAGTTVTATKTVWGAVEDVSLSFQTSAEASGLRPSLFVHLWRSEFEKESFNYCVVGGREYRITQTGKSYNELFVKLMLERG